MAEHLHHGLLLPRLDGGERHACGIAIIDSARQPEPCPHPMRAQQACGFDELANALVPQNARRHQNHRGIVTDAPIRGRVPPRVDATARDEQRAARSHEVRADEGMTIVGILENRVSRAPVKHAPQHREHEQPQSCCLSARRKQEAESAEGIDRRRHAGHAGGQRSV